MELGNHDIVALTEFRRALHRRPELSGEETRTAATVARELHQCGADRILPGLGGTGCAAVFEGREPGPAVMIRCELDGLPIEEISTADHRSETPGQGHLCGHDGHMAIVLGVARALGRARPAAGRVVLLFQPAEETGAGAAAVIADPRYREIAPDYAFALHNMPGLPLGQVSTRAGVMNCASRGMRLRLSGRTSHASAPEDGISPMEAMARLMPGLEAIGPGGAMDEEFALVTVTHARLGEPCYGIAPGQGEIRATLRAVTDARMDGLVAGADALARAAATEAGLALDIGYEDVFPTCRNDPDAARRLEEAADGLAPVVAPMPAPMRWSEDFGHYGGAGAKSAMFLLGAGEAQPQLHNPDYDFPDDLIPIGAGVFLRAIRGLCGRA